MTLKTKYIFFILLFIIYSCTTKIRGYRVQGGSKKRALSFNKYSTGSGSRYGKMRFGSSRQQKKSFKYNYGRINSFGGRNKSGKSKYSVYGSSISFGRNSYRNNASRSNFGQFISFGKGRKSRSQAYSKSVYGSNITFGNKSKRRSFTRKGGIYGSQISFGKNKKWKRANNKIYGSDIRFGTRSKGRANASGTYKRGDNSFWSFNWLRGKHRGAPQTRKKKSLQLRLFDPKQKAKGSR